MVASSFSPGETPPWRKGKRHQFVRLAALPDRWKKCKKEDYQMAEISTVCAREALAFHTSSPRQLYQIAQEMLTMPTPTKAGQARAAKSMHGNFHAM
jgi:hypothetical protein